MPWLPGDGLGLWLRDRNRRLDREDRRAFVLARDADLLRLADRLHPPSIGAIGGVGYPSWTTSMVTRTSVATATAR